VGPRSRYYGRVVFNQDLGKLAASRSVRTRRCARYVLRRLMIDRTTVSVIAVELGVSWHTVNTIAMGATAALVAALRAPTGWPE
jgi:transposase